MFCPGVQRGARCLHPPSSARVLHGALPALLCGTCRQLFPGAHRGLALCHVALAPSMRNTPALGTQGRAAGHLQILGPSAELGDRQWGSQGWVMHSRQGTRLCKSCENPALKAPSLSVGARQTKWWLPALAYSLGSSWWESLLASLRITH